MGSNIPLPALNIQTPQPTNPLSEYAKVVSLKGMMQQQQEEQQVIQQKQQQINDVKAGTAAYQEWDAKSDPHGTTLPSLTLKHGGSAVAAQAIQQHNLDQTAKLSQIAKDDAETGKNNLANMATQNNLLLGRLQAATGVSDDKLHDSVAGALNDSVKDGLLDPQHAQQYQQLLASQPDPKLLRPSLDIAEKKLMSQKDQFEQAQKERETHAKELEAQAQSTNSQNTATRLQQELPGGQLRAPEQQKMDAFMKNPPPGYKPNALDFMRFNATVTPQAQINVAAAAGGGLQDAALDQAAEMYHQTGKLPPGGRGVAGLAQNRKIMNRSAELYPGSITEGTAEYAANKKSLGELQPLLDKVDSFENTAGKNLKLFLDQAKNITDTGAKFTNTPLRLITRGMLGTGDMAAFDTSRQVAVNEIGRVLNSANAQGVVSDSARGEINELIGKDATFNSIKRASDILVKDMANRHESYQQQIEDIKHRLPGQRADNKTDTTTTAAPPATTAKPFSWDKFPEHK